MSFPAPWKVDEAHFGARVPLVQELRNRRCRKVFCTAAPGLINRYRLQICSSLPTVHETAARAVGDGWLYRFCLFDDSSRFLSWTKVHAGRGSAFNRPEHP